jgi:uncharacterized membrane protein (UPF0136 family)
MKLAIVILLVVYSTLLEIGGIIGYKKAGSKASLIAGVMSGSILLVLSTLIQITENLAPLVYLALAITLVLVATFVKRYLTTGKVMPAGMLAVVSIVVAIVLGIAILQQ